jgi:flavin-dependent dehydrogenase
MGLGTVLESAPASYGARTIFMGCAREGYIGLVRLEDGRVGVAAAVDPSAVRRAGNPSLLARSLLDQAGLPPIKALDQGKWGGTAALTLPSNGSGGERVFLLGDSAGFVEPFTGEGIAWAFESAQAVVPFVLEGVSKWRPELVHAWGEVFLKTVADRQTLCRVLARALRYPLLTRLLIGALGRAPWLALPVLRQLDLGPA